MASRKTLLIAAAAMALAVVVGALLPATASAEAYIMVGDLDGWNLDVNYTAWVINTEPFKDFKYTRGTHNVVMLTSNDPGSEGSYTSCLVPNTAQPFDTGDDRVQLPDVEKVYFFCGVMNHCDNGMKFSVDVYPSDG